MRDSRDYLIAGLAAALLFCAGILVGRNASVLPEASAQGTPNGGNNAANPNTPVVNLPTPGSGITIQPPTPSPRPGLEGRTAAARPSDSDSNNRFVAVTCPTTSGESVLFLVDSESEQVAVYRYKWGQGLEYLSGRKIEYDLKVSGYRDTSELSYDQMRELYQKEAARQAAKAAGK
jgi:hypothetical protein